MAQLGMQMLASALCLLGWFMAILCCIMPMWRVTAFVGTTIITSQSIWEGIWMSCVDESTGHIQCKPYESLLELSGDLQAARALTVLAIVTGGFGLVLAFVGGKCTRFLDEEKEEVKGKVAMAAGMVLVVAGVMCLIPTSWAAGAVVRTFYSATVDSQRREIGASLYIGWGASLMLILGGGLFISSSCPPKDREEARSPSVRYLVVRSSNGSRKVISNGGSSLRSQPVGPALYSRSQSIEGASVRSAPRGLVYPNAPPWSAGAELASQQQSGGSTGGSRLSSRLERSETPSTKSQLKRAASHDSLLESVKSHTSENPPSNAGTTYI